MKKLLFTLIIVIFTSMATASIYYDTGLNYTIGATNPNDGTIYLGSSVNDSLVVLDYNTANSPGTHLKVVNGGFGPSIWAYNNSMFTVSGGSSGMIYAFDNSVVEINEGFSVDMNARNNSTVILRGGVITNTFHAQNDSTVEISGGSIGEWLVLCPG